METAIGIVIAFLVGALVAFPLGWGVGYSDRRGCKNYWKESARQWRAGADEAMKIASDWRDLYFSLKETRKR